MTTALQAGRRLIMTSHPLPPVPPPWRSATGGQGLQRVPGSRRSCPPHLRAPRKRPAAQEGGPGGAERGARPGVAAAQRGGHSETAHSGAGSRLLNNRLVDNRLTRAVGKVAETPQRGPGEHRGRPRRRREPRAVRQDHGGQLDEHGRPVPCPGHQRGRLAAAPGAHRPPAVRADGPGHRAGGSGRRSWKSPSQIQLSNIAELRPRPRMTFPRGRFDLVFVDGSWLALCCSFQDDMEAMVTAFHGR